MRKNHYKKICAWIVLTAILICNTGAVFATQDTSNVISGNNVAISENAKSESEDVIPQVSDSLVSENSDEEPAKGETISEDNAGADSEEPAGVDTYWYKEYEYSQDDVNKIITLNHYKGDSDTITIPEKAKVLISGNLVDYFVALNKEVFYKKYSEGDYYLEYNPDIVSIKIEKNVIMPSNCSRMFITLSKLKSIDLSNADTSRVTTMESMFSGCHSLKDVNLSGIDTSNVTDMSHMFERCSDLEEIDLSGINVSEVTNTKWMFEGCSSLKNLDLSNWNTSKVTDMEWMFAQCVSLNSLDISGFDTSKVTSMYCMFDNCKSLTNLDVSNFDTSNVTDMGSMFSGCERLKSIDVSSFNTSKVTKMQGMFGNCKSLTNLDVRNFDTSNVTGMDNMFQFCSSLSALDLSGFDTSKVTNMNYMFEYCYAIKFLDLSGFDTSNVTTWYGIFNACYSLEILDISNFDASAISSTLSTLGIGGIYSLYNIKTPKNWYLSESLRYNDFYEFSNGKFGTVSYSKLPIGLDHSIELLRKGYKSVFEDNKKYDVKTEINGRGYAQYCFPLYDNKDRLLKDTTISYYLENPSGNIVGAVKTAKTDGNGYLTISTNHFDNVQQAENFGTTVMKQKLIAYFVYKPDNKTNVLSENRVTFDISVKPLSFKQKWTLSTKASVEASIGESAAFEIGPIQAKASVAEAAANREVGTTLDVKHEFDSGRRNLELGQEFNQKVGINGDIGPKADVDVGVHFEPALVNAAAGVTVGGKMHYSREFKDYDPNRDALDVGTFLLLTEALGVGNVALLAIAHAVNPDFNFKASTGGDLSVKAGADVGSVEMYWGEQEDGKKKKDSTTLAEGKLAGAEYNSVYSVELERNTADPQGAYTKKMKKESGLDVDVLSGKMPIPVIGTVKAGIYNNTFWPKNYSLTASPDKNGKRKLEIKELTGLGITTGRADDDNKRYFNIDTPMKIDRECMDVLEFSGENYDKICENVPPLNSFANGNGMYFFDSAFADTNSFFQKSGVNADYRRELTDTFVFSKDFGVGAQLEVGAKAKVGLKGTGDVTYVDESGEYISKMINGSMEGMAIPTAVNEIEDPVKNGKVSITSLTSEATNVILTKAIGVTMKVVKDIKEKAEEALCDVEAAVAEYFTKQWKIIISTVKDGNYIASVGETGEENAGTILEPVSYTIMTYGDAAAADGMEESAGTVGDMLDGTAVTVGSTYYVSVIDSGNGDAEISDFSEAPLTISLGYNDELLASAGVSEDDAKNLEIFRYDKDSCGYKSVGGTVDTVNKKVTVEGITSPGEFILAIQHVKDPDEVYVYLKESEKTIKPGESVQLSAKTMDVNGNPIDNAEIIWESTDNSIVTVENGKITGVAEGEADIKAKCGSHQNICTVTVSNDKPSGGDTPPGNDIPPADDEIPDNAPSSGIWVKGLKQEFAYTGTLIKPEIKVYDGRTRLYEKKDYTLKYKNNTKPGTAYAVLTMKGNYSGSQDVPFTIRPASLITDISADAVYAAYKKNKIQKLKPVLYVGGQKLKYGKKDLTFTYPSESVSSNSKPYSDMGTWKIHIAANNTNLFTGEQDVDLVIVNKPVMSAVSIKTSKSGLGYTGSPVTPVFTVKYKGKSLTQGTDYTVIYKDAHTDIGNHMVVLKGNNKDYFGSKTVTFKISGKYDLASAKGGIEFDKASLNADGSVPYTFGGAKPVLIVKYDGKTLTAGKDYIVSYRNNKALGTATATVKGKGSYKGSPTKTFEIKQRDINTLSLNIADKLYSSKSGAYKKTPIVFTDGDYKNQKLKKDSDYTVEYSGVSGNAPSAGSKILVTLQGKGNYNGTINTSYMIIDKDYDFTKAKVTVNGGKAYAYTGKAITPPKSDLQVSIKNKGSLGDEDYDIIGYYNNIKKGNSAYIKLRGKGKYSGVKMVKFKIQAAPMESEWSGVIMNLKDAFAW